MLPRLCIVIVCHCKFYENIKKKKKKKADTVGKRALKVAILPFNSELKQDVPKQR